MIESLLFHTGECHNESERDGSVIHSETGEVMDLFSDDFEIAPGLDIYGLYEHYKTSQYEKKIYLVHMVLRRKNTGEILVIYEPLYTETKKLYARPLDIFNESVEYVGQQVRRFAPIS